METQITDATEYRNLPLALLAESTTNPRRSFDEAALKELAESIRAQGVLSPLLVRPLNERSFEIVAGARRYRAAQLAEVATVPVRIVQLTDAQALEAQLIENLQRRDVHPMEEAQGFKALLNLEEPQYSIEQITAKTGKSPAYVAQRLKLTELATPVVDAFYRSEIGVGHALLLAKLPEDRQEQALSACFKEVFNGGKKPARILLPVRNLQFWIETNIMLLLQEAPFDMRDAHLVAIAGSCVDCPKRTGHNKLLFADVRQDACSDPTCYQAKVDAHVTKTVAAKPKLVQITTAYGKPAEGSPILTRSQYVEIRPEKPKNKYRAATPEFKTCKSTTEAIIAEGIDKGTFRKVCADPNCPIHHPKKKQSKADAAHKAEQEQRRREEALAAATGLRVLSAIVAAVPVRLMKRDLLFIVERLVRLMDEQRLSMMARQHGIRQKRDDGGVAKIVTAFVRSADEGTLSRLLVEVAVLLGASRTNAATVLRDAASVYKVDTDAITLKVKQEFAAKEKDKAARKSATKPSAKIAKKAAAA
jgi:ParB family chromosome partitioning protein